MKGLKFVMGIWIGILIVLGIIQNGLAIDFVTPVGDLNLTGKIYTQGSWRMEDSEGFTFPKTDAGDFIQHRNLLQIEAKNKFNENFSIFLSGRLTYDGVSDYGAHQFRRYDLSDVYAKLREGYLDINYGPVFFRLGRQNLSWGEADLFRLLDGINPLDNTFGLFFEDLDERRIPIDMARLVVDLGRVGPVSSLTVEGFIGSGEKQAPLTAPGSPYALPSPPSPVPVRDEKTHLKDIRGGARILGTTKGVSWSIGHYWSYPDSPVPVFRYSTPGDALSTYLNLKYKRQQTTGGSFTFFTGIDATQTVVRGEFAYVWDEGIFIPSKNLPVGQGTIYVPGIGFIDPGIPVPLPGEIPEAGVFKWVIGLDNNIWIRALNKTNTFSVSLQAYGRHIAKDWSDEIRLPVNRYPSGNFVKPKKHEYQFTAVVSTYYLRGNLIPELAMAYDPRGAFFIQPTVKYRWRNFEAMLRYSAIMGNFINIGFFRDRDQISLRLSYYFK
ncbi:MAG: DUF1302 family protein [Candidatus Anstonellales archaeon]